MRSGWVAVRCVFRIGDVEAWTYEERITLWWAVDMASAIARAETEAHEYAERVGCEYLGFAQSYDLFDSPGDGAEVFSLLRDSDLGSEEYLDTFFDSGGEYERHV